MYDKLENKHPDHHTWRHTHWLRQPKQFKWAIFVNYQLSGNIPSNLGNLDNLKVLVMPDNKLNGIIPSELGNLSNLEILDLKNNELNLCPQLNNLLFPGNSNISDGNNFDCILGRFLRYRFRGLYAGFHKFIRC